MSCTITEETQAHVKKIKFEWVSAADGTVAGTTTGVYSGLVERLVTIPDGTDAPDDNYNVFINDEDDTDILMGAGATRDTANTEQVLASSLGCVANDKLALAITGAGAANAGTVIVYIK
jgi:hypothetical protein